MNNAQEFLTLPLNELELRVIANAKRNRNTLLVGFTGVGKSQWIEAIFKKIGWSYLPYIPSMGNPSHINGLPFEKDGQAEFLFYEFMRSIMSATEKTIVHIEDFIQAPPLMQAALMSVTHKREVNGKKIPDCVAFVIDTNDETHNAGGTKVISPFISRGCTFRFPVDVKAWLAWGMETKRIRKEILLFIHAFPNALCCDKVPRGIQAFNSPRTWEMASEWVEDGVIDAITLSSAVGVEEGHNCAAFIKDFQRFGNVLAKVLNDPQSAPLFTELSEVYGCLLILSNHFEKKNVNAITQYFKRYNNEELIKVLFALGCQTFPDAKETKEYVENNI